MTQIARPDSDISVGTWSPFPVDPTTLFDKIDEETPNGDTDYIASDLDEDECEVGVDDNTDPGIGTGHVIRCYAKSPNGGGAKEQMTIALVENGNVRGVSPAANVDRVAYGLIEYALSEAEANTIQNYANLRLRFHITKVNSNEPIRITQAEFECPDATEEHSGSSSISGNGSLTGVAKKGGIQSALISAKGALVVVGLVAMLGIGSISGGGAVATIGQKATQADAVLSGGGTIVAIGTKAEGEPHSGSAVVSGNGAVTTQGEKEVSGAGAISGGGTIITTGTKAEGEPHSGSALISGGGTVLSEGEKGAEGSPAVSGNGALASIGEKETEGIGLISGNGSISTVGEKQEGEAHYGSAIISGGGEFVSTGMKVIWATGSQVSREEKELLLIGVKEPVFIGKKKPVFISKN